jgi:hypothetical protein
MMAKILSSDVLITRATGEKTTEIVVSDFYQNYAGGNYIEQKMEVRLDVGQLEELITRLNECLADMRTSA